MKGEKEKGNTSNLVVPCQSMSFVKINSQEKLKTKVSLVHRRNWRQVHAGRLVVCFSSFLKKTRPIALTRVEGVLLHCHGRVGFKFIVFLLAVQAERHVQPV